MIGDGAVGGLIFKVAVRGDQYTGHHGQRAGGSGDEVAHHVAVVILAGPDDAAGGADDLGRHVVDEGVAIGETRLFKGRPVLLVVHLLKQQLEGLVVVLGDGILAGKPHVLSHGEPVGEAAPGKGENGIVPVVHGLHHAGAAELIHRLAGGLHAVFIGEDQLRLSLAGDPVFHGLIQITVGVAGDGDGFFPAGHHGLDP